MEIYRTNGTCSKEIITVIDENDVIKSVKFVNGCIGNSQGISRLVVGHKVDEIIALLEGIQCRNGTSCPDQLAKALKKHKLRKEHPEQEF